MAEKIYTCECGKIFTNPQSFNGHKSSCKVHHIAKYGSTDKLETKLKQSGEKISKTLINQNKQKRNLVLEQWISEQHTCEKCGKIMTKKFASGRFCSRSCANSKIQTEEINNTRRKTSKISSTISGAARKQNNIAEYNKNPSRCVICGKELDYNNRRHKTCSAECLHQKLILNGCKAAESQNRRSKNEIVFCNLCESYYNNVKNNETIFNGWDADIILEDYKVAILWNGPWHYKQLSKKQSLKQVQNRDKLKIEQIQNCGYIPYIIEDKGSYNIDFVNEQFEILKQCYPK